MNSAALLDRLRAAHQAVLDCITEMERVTGEPAPDAVKYTAARFRISRASLERRALWLSARQYLESRVGPTESADLRFLCTMDSELGRSSASHVERWTIAAIQGDWLGYREASRQIRLRMKDCIVAEKRLLYPLLARYP